MLAIDRLPCTDYDTQLATLSRQQYEALSIPARVREIELSEGWDFEDGEGWTVDEQRAIAAELAELAEAAAWYGDGDTAEQARQLISDLA